MEFVFHTMRDRLDLIEQIRGAAVHPEDPLVHAQDEVVPVTPVLHDEDGGRFVMPPVAHLESLPPLQ